MFFLLNGMFPDIVKLGAIFLPYVFLPSNNWDSLGLAVIFFFLYSSSVFLFEIEAILELLIDNNSDKKLPEDELGQIFLFEQPKKWHQSNIPAYSFLFLLYLPQLFIP